MYRVRSVFGRDAPTPLRFLGSLRGSLDAGPQCSQLVRWRQRDVNHNSGSKIRCGDVTPKTYWALSARSH